MTARKENCPFAFRKGNGKNVHCTIIAKNPLAKWDFCAYQHSCCNTGRWEATSNPTECEIRRKEQGGK